MASAVRSQAQIQASSRLSRNVLVHSALLPGFCVHSVAIVFPPLVIIRASVAAVWLYEGLWCKLLGYVPSQVQVATAVPRLGPRFGLPFLKVLGLVEAALAAWVMSGIAPGTCTIVQTALLVTLNANGLVWARHIIHDPGGMVVKNIAFLVLVWICGAISGGPR
jgi:DoxX-like protein